MVERIIKITFLYIVAFASLTALFYGLVAISKTTAYYLGGGYNESPAYPSSCYGANGSECTEAEKALYETYNTKSIEYSKAQQKGILAQDFTDGVSRVVVSLVAFALSLVLLKKYQV